MRCVVTVSFFLIDGDGRSFVLLIHGSQGTAVMMERCWNDNAGCFSLCWDLHLDCLPNWRLELEIGLWAT